MICINFEIRVMYHSVVKVKKIAGFSFSNLKVVSVYSYMLPQISDMLLTKKSELKLSIMYIPYVVTHIVVIT